MQRGRCWRARCQFADAQKITGYVQRYSHYRNKPSCGYGQNIVDGEAVVRSCDTRVKESVLRKRWGTARKHQPGELQDSGRKVKRSRRFNLREGCSDERGAQELRNEASAEVRGGRPRWTKNVVIAGIKEVDQIALRDASLEVCRCRDMTEDNGRRPAFSRVCNCEEVGESGITVIGRDT